jgi:hypothetical protein
MLDTLNKCRLETLCDAKGCRMVDALEVVKAVFAKFRTVDAMRNGAKVDGQDHNTVSYARKVCSQKNLPSAVEDAVWAFFTD